MKTPPDPELSTYASIAVGVVDNIADTFTPRSVADWRLVRHDGGGILAVFPVGSRGTLRDYSAVVSWTDDEPIGAVLNRLGATRSDILGEMFTAIPLLERDWPSELPQELGTDLEAS